MSENAGQPESPPPAARPEAEQPAAPRRRHRRVVRQGTEREAVLGVPSDERGGHGENDDRLLRDVPPHWGRR
ncbi:hypothetical protein [Xylanimonas oleitrophica]|uniref:hypothetical protein n=1 Tax=Xylanimonas oleitrophica TaxID=2607479 RepID=UPI0011B7CEB8|nr:hypothetical protein [Xylanimonas oleitrophica]